MKRSRKSKTVLAWHWHGDKLRDGRPIPEVGKKLKHSGALSLCESGLHGSDRITDSLKYADDPSEANAAAWDAAWAAAWAAAIDWQEKHLVELIEAEHKRGAK